MDFGDMTLEDDHEECQRVTASLNAVIVSLRAQINDMADRLEQMEGDEKFCRYRDEVVELTQRIERIRAVCEPLVNTDYAQKPGKAAVARLVMAILDYSRDASGLDQAMPYNAAFSPRDVAILGGDPSL